MAMTIDVYSRRLWQRFDGWTFRDHVDPYLVRMQAAGYRPQSVCRATRAVGDYARWLLDDHGDADAVARATAFEFLSNRRAIGKLQNGDRSAVLRFVAHLCETGAIQSPPETDRREQILNLFNEYLKSRRGLHATTIASSVYYARSFLREIWTGSDELSGITRCQAIDYVERHAHDNSPSTTQAIFGRLRSFLRFLFAERLLDDDLSPCIPAVRGKRHASLPKFLTPLQLESVLNTCDRTTSAGRRDYAVLLLLARLGLRAHEVAKLTLEDIDWSAGTVSITGKAGTRSVLPLPNDVGAAITDYLVNDRPPCEARQVFLRHETPQTGFPSAAGIIQIANRVLKRAGITGIANVRSHAFRHTLATDMVRAGATLTEIGQILRHLNHDTTRIYAKVDLPRLRLLTQAWPEDVQ